MTRPTKLVPETQAQIVETLKLGCTIADSCASADISEPTYYSWRNRGAAELERVEANPRATIRQSEEIYVEFFKAITHAQMEARRRATVAVTRALAGTQSKTETVETFTETRLDRQGNPYQYKKTTHKNSVTENPPDWRAGIEYLKRRDSEHWSGNPETQINVNITLIHEVVKALEAAGKDPAAIFEQLIQRAKQEVDSQ